MNYTIIRSNRRTMAIEITTDGLRIRAPRWASRADIDRFVREHQHWIESHLAKAEEQKRQQEAVPTLTTEELQSLAKQATRVIPERVRYYAPIVGVTYGRITTRHQHSRWGSCSSKGNLSFNCLLMLAPPEVLDSVVVHELCHRKEMNHSAAFYAEVLRAYPEYHRWNRWLKEHGAALMARNGQE